MLSPTFGHGAAAVLRGASDQTLADTTPFAFTWQGSTHPDVHAPTQMCTHPLMLYWEMELNCTL